MRRVYTKLKKILVSLSAFILIGLLASVVIAHLMVKKFTAKQRYSTQRLQEHAQNRVKLLTEFSAQEVSFITEDGLTLSAFLLVRKSAHRVILICHGYRMAKERMIHFAAMFPHDTLLLFDYRAHGQSQGDRTTFGFDERKDVIAAVKFLQSHPDTAQLPLFGIGVSMGAVSLLGAASQTSCFKALVLDSLFANLAKQVRRIVQYRYRLPAYFFPYLGQKMFEYRLNFSCSCVDALVWATQVSTPILLIHSEKDCVAFVEDAHTLYDCIQAPKELWLVPDSMHARIFVDHRHEYAQKVSRFFDVA